MRSTSEDLAHYLASLGVGKFAGTCDDEWPIAYAAEPAEPDNHITIYETGGDPADTDELDLDRPTIQVRVRSKNYGAAWSKQRDIKHLLTTGEVLTTEWRYMQLWMTSDIIPIGRDENNRFLLTANYQLVRHER